jgi:uncharacterized protein
MDKEIIKTMRKAICSGDLDLLNEMLEKNDGLINEETGFGSWLHIAAEQGQLEIVKFLHEKGVDINVNGGFANCAAICEAALYGHISIVQYLFENGANLDVSEATKNPLFTAVYNGHFEVAKYLIDNGIDITIRYKTNSLDNEGAYEFARTYGKEEIAEYLKEKLIDTDYFSANRKDHNPLVNR